MTLGDAALKHEVLSLFHAHVALLTEKMRRRDPAAVPALAHTLKGSALGIGARKVARARMHFSNVPPNKPQCSGSTERSKCAGQDYGRAGALWRMTL